MEKHDHEKHSSIFIQGAIPVEKLTRMMEHHRNKTGIGAHDMFIGQVRADVKNNVPVRFIEYTAYEEMALKVYQQLHEAVCSKYQLTCLHTLHSLGIVHAGEWSLVVFASAPHRKDCFDACREMVERIKTELPVWGKEVFENEMSSWKINQ